MSIDKVQPLKLEDPGTGGNDTDLFPSGLNPLQDHVECRGVVLADDTTRDDRVVISRDNSGNLTFKDVAKSTALTLSDLIDAWKETNLIYYDVVLAPTVDEVFGTVSGLLKTPTKVIGFPVGESSVTVQSGINYYVSIVKYNSDGWDFRLATLNNEWWPGPDSVTVRIQFLWSE